MNHRGKEDIWKDMWTGARDVPSARTTKSLNVQPHNNKHNKSNNNKLNTPTTTTMKSKQHTHKQTRTGTSTSPFQVHMLFNK